MSRGLQGRHTRNLRPPTPRFGQIQPGPPQRGGYGRTTQPTLLSTPLHRIVPYIPQPLANGGAREESPVLRRNPAQQFLKCAAQLKRVPHSSMVLRFATRPARQLLPPPLKRDETATMGSTARCAAPLWVEAEVAILDRCPGFQFQCRSKWAPLVANPLNASNSLSGVVKTFGQLQLGFCHAVHLPMLPLD